MNKDSKIVIVGVGALGSHTAMFLRNVGNLTFVDHDRTEAKNILSQFHTKMGSGKNKALGLQQALLGLFGVKAEAVPHRLVPDNAEAILGSAGLVIDCTDNAAARRCIQTYVRSKNIPCLHGCLSLDGQFARVIWDDIFKEDEEGIEGQATCEDGQNLPFHALAGAQIAIVAQRFLKTGVRTSLMLLPDKIIQIA